ncbi:MAG: MoxR family ATPase [Alicyclobacillus herbarius]|uniref:AAA family ATPase n=1 Tax=Alicyclobacillus herbarius TaxID=122960 RepID=UPI0023549B78|nr:MoxR family ATPase [Alicyclobacillus herbarius]MCL6631860.1 MoxR family ATPase [Alicyclobacillus herbarius]
MNHSFQGPEDVERAFAEAGYIADEALATSVFLALTLNRPLFLEGEAGAGKTEVAKVAATVLDRPLVRLQCYEGMDKASALYEWNYPLQLLHIRLWEREATDAKGREALEQELFGPRFLLRRPLLQAVNPDGPAPVLLIDEVDRSDAEFEAFLLEVLAEFQVTIPELGTLRAEEEPLVVLTSNRTRELHDALKRRCLYHWLDYPSFDKEVRIVRQRVPGIGDQLAASITAFVQRLRQEPLFKAPGVAETLEWAEALQALGTVRLGPDQVTATLGCLVKYRDDLDLLLGERGGDPSPIHRLLRESGATG